MGIDAVALVHCKQRKVLATLVEGSLGPRYEAQLERAAKCAEAGEEAPLPIPLTLLGKGKDVARLFTGVRFESLKTDPILAQRVAHRIVELLPEGAHADPRLTFYPDVAEPRAQTYAEILAELGAAALAVSTEPVSREVREAYEAEQRRKLDEMLASLAQKPAVSPEQHLEARREQGRKAAHVMLEALGFLSPKEGDTMTEMEIAKLDGTKQTLRVSLENASRVLRQKAGIAASDDPVEANRKLLERIRKGGDPAKTKEWESALGISAAKADKPSAKPGVGKPGKAKKPKTK